MLTESLSEGSKKRKGGPEREKLEEDQVDNGKETLKSSIDPEATVVSKILTESLSEGNKKRKKRLEREKLEEDQMDDGKETLMTSVDPESTVVTDQPPGELFRIDGELSESISGGNVDNDEMKTRKKSKSIAQIKNKCQSSELETALKTSKQENIFSNATKVSNSCASSELDEMRSRSITLEDKGFCEGHHCATPFQMVSMNESCEKGLNEVKNETIIVGGTTHVCSYHSKDVGYLSKDFGQFPRKSDSPTSSRKLLVLDVNGLLAYIIMPQPKDCKGDTNILGRAIFKRPYCDDFLKFCFRNFDVGIWSSRSKKIIERIVEYLLGDLKNRLLFCWDISHSTQTGFNTLENIHKPLVFKELRSIWENDDPTSLWKKGDYNESNTLLLDDSPYKALINPLHTAIFPRSYHYKDKDDNSLGPGGDLRVYLEGLLTSQNVRDYVKHHPFGQHAINETNLSWNFYSGVLQTMFSNASV